MAGSEKFGAELKQILSTAQNPDSVRECLGVLFPRLISELDLVLSTDQMDGKARLRNRRLSQSDSAWSYFRLDPKPFTWSHSEIEGMLRAENPVSAFDEFNEKLRYAPKSERQRLRRVYFDILSAHFERDIEITQAWIDAILLNSRDLIQVDDATTGVFSFSTTDRLRILLIRALEQLNEERRAELFIQAISAAEDLTLLCEVFRSIAGDLRVDGVKPGRVGFGFGAPTEMLRNQLLARVRRLAMSGAIWSQAEPGKLLWFWWGSGDEQEVKTFVSRAIKTDDGLYNMLDITIGKVSSSSGNFERVNEKSWSNIVNIEELEEAAKSIVANPGKTTDHARAHRFLQALKIGREEDW